MPPQLSIVIPAFNEEANIRLAIARTTVELEKLDLDWEMIVVDDGSRDDTFGEVGRCAADDPRVRALRFSRNFGSHVAITAGLENASGDACLVITADLEEPPEAIPAFLAKWREGFEIVWGVRAARLGGAEARAASSLYHRLFRLLGLPNSDGQEIGGGFFLVDRRVAEALRQVKERNRTLIGLLLWMGFRQTQLAYQPNARLHGGSKWTFGKKVKLLIDSFVAFSYLPIRFVSLVGIAISTLSFLYGLAVIVSAILGGASVQGWPTLMATVLFLGGVQLLVTGLMGEYLWRALDEARGRPLYIVAERLGFGLGQGTATRD